ncbi:MAG: excinuclease ABC subunit UvrC [Candidatus Gastranaerophilales bacterium]|nr:excinuclease ABC subunit UvrC [Candidatus Gastranaerophilales bacterium]
MKKQLSEKLKLLPNLAGCYLYHDKKGEIIYVGKAKNLKKRVKSYFNKTHDSTKLNILVPKVENLEYIITNSEAEALILESHLIKKHQPKYNILLKDDKKYPYFLVTDEDFPRIIVTRKRNKNLEKGKYYGPYTDARAMYSTLDFLKNIFPLKQCKTPKFKNRPCLYYQIGRCLAPCQGLVSSEEYKAVINQAELFLQGKQTELMQQLMEQIKKYSDAQQYEKAARLRDSYFDLQKTLERQKVVYENTKLNEDVISMMYEDGVFAIVILMIREGRLIDKKDFTYFVENTDKTELFETFFREYYSNLSLEFPDKIVSRELEALGEKEVYQEWLEILSKKKVKISYAKTKQGQELQALADKNAKVLLNNAKLEKMSKIRDDFNEIGSFLAEKLKLKNFPHRIECYDISHIQGTNTVASMVTFVNGVAKKSAYKKFKIRLAEGKPDDFLSMKEVLTRRLNRLGEKDWEKPDLIIIDGGKGQLSAVMKAVEEIEWSNGKKGKENPSPEFQALVPRAEILPSPPRREGENCSTVENIDFISLAKRQEEVFLPNQSKSILLPRNSSALFLIQRIRDEAHRFAITYHRKLRDTLLG